MKITTMLWLISFALNFLAAIAAFAQEGPKDPTEGKAKGFNGSPPVLSSPHYLNELECYRELKPDAKNRSYSDVIFSKRGEMFVVVPKKRLGKAGFYVYTQDTAYYVPYSEEFCESTESFTKFRIEFQRSDSGEHLFSIDLSVNPKTYEHRIEESNLSRHCSQISKVDLTRLHATDRHSDQTLNEVLITMLNNASGHGRDVTPCRRLKHTGLQYALKEFEKRGAEDSGASASKNGVSREAR